MQRRFYLGEEIFVKKLFKKIIPVLICTLILCAAAVFSFASEAPVIIKTGDFT